MKRAGIKLLGPLCIRAGCWRQAGKSGYCADCEAIVKAREAAKKERS